METPGAPLAATLGAAGHDAGHDAGRDATLVVRARTGDALAQRELVHRHLRSAHAVALRVLGDLTDAEDAVQDAFVAVFERLDQCRPEHRFRAWLLQCVRNRAISLLRHRRVRRADVLGSGPGEVEVAASPAGDPLAGAMRADLRSRLVAVLDTLPAPERETLILHDVEGWKHREIAAHLGVREGTSRSYLHDARRRMRAALGSQRSALGSRLSALGR